MQRHTSSIASMNAWASPPERPFTISTSLLSEKIFVIRETRLSTVRVSLINLFQVEVLDPSAVRQKGYLWMESQASLVGEPTRCTPKNSFGLLTQITPRTTCEIFSIMLSPCTPPECTLLWQSRSPSVVLRHLRRSLLVLWFLREGGFTILGECFT